MAMPEVDNSLDFRSMLGRRSHKKSMVSAASSTADFQCDVDLQTESPTMNTAWTQIPCYTDEESSYKIQTRIGCSETSILPSAQGRVYDPMNFRNFMARSGHLMLEMLSEELHNQKVWFQRKSRNQSLVVEQTEYVLNSVLSHCDILRVSVFKGRFPLFVITHRWKKKKAVQEGRVCGLISGWNGFSTHSPIFILGGYEVPTCAVALPPNGQLIVAGFCDGSLACWKPKEPCSMSTVSQAVGGIGEGHVQVPSAFTCGEHENNHCRAVVDVVAIGEKYDGADREAGLLGVVASMDECGAIALWHALEKTSTSWNADASTETAQNVNVVLIRIRQLESWNKSKVVPAHLYNNTANGGTLLVTTVQGHIIAPNQQTTEYKTVRYGKDTGFPITSVGFSPFHAGFFLAADERGCVRLYSEKYRKELCLWYSENEEKIISICWSSTHPSIFYTVSASGEITMWTLLNESPKIPRKVTGQVRSKEATDRKWENAVQIGHCVTLWTSTELPLCVILNEVLDEHSKGTGIPELFTPVHDGHAADTP